MGTGIDQEDGPQKPRRAPIESRQSSDINSASDTARAGTAIPPDLPRDYPASEFDREVHRQVESGIQSQIQREEGRETRRAPERQQSRELDAARTALDLIFGPATERSFAVQFWNGEIEPTADPTPPFTLVLNHAGTLRRMLRPPFELSICEAYIAGDFDIIGDVERAAALEGDLRGGLSSTVRLARLTRALLTLPTNDTPAPHPVVRGPERGSLHTPERDAAAVRSHYDVGNDFYKLWLDKRMVYSCAYFTNSSATLEEAQEAKLEHICRKLRLAPGEKLLDVGCGWGGLIMHAVERFGVTALGITLSYEQAALARERIEERGLSARCTVEVRDYRHLTAHEEFDKIASVGMVEHVGLARLPVYFNCLFSYLKPGGLLLNHGIVHAASRDTSKLRDKVFERLWGDNEFINKYVFPDGELPHLSQVIATAEATGFETRDAESLREHYAMTLRHWVRRLEHERAAAVESAGEEIYRIWRLYMAASAYGFASGRLAIDQVLLAKRTSAGTAAIPLTRADIYS